MLEHYVTKFGYVAIFAGTWIEGEVFVVLGGFCAHREYFNPYLVIVMGALGAFSGDLFYYSMGRRFGSSLFESQPRLARLLPRLEHLMQRYHVAWLFGVRYLWGVRWAAAAFAGSLRMSLPRYCVVDLTACLIWAAVMVSIGYTAGEAVEQLLGDVERYETILLMVVVIVAAIAPIVHYVAIAVTRGRARSISSNEIQRSN